MDPVTGAPTAGAPAGAGAGTPAGNGSSADAALAHLNNNPAGGSNAAAGGSAAASGAGAAAAGAGAGAPAAAASTSALPDFAELLKDDLASTAAAPSAAATTEGAPAAAADPLAGLQDNPRVKELIAAETTVKETMALSPDYIKNPAHIQDAVRDADVLWKISDGKLPVTVILDAAKVQSPQSFPKILADLKAFVEKETGTTITPAAAANLTPEQQQIAALQKRLDDQDAATKNQAQVRRIAAAKPLVTAKIDELLKDSAFEGDGAYFLTLAGNLLRGKETQLVDAVEKGDYKLLETTIKQVRTAEARLLDARIKRLQALYEKKRTTVPNQAAGGASANNGGAPNVAPINDKSERIKAAAAMLRG